MSHNKQFWVSVSSVLMLAIVCTPAFADLNAGDIAYSFNQWFPDHERPGVILWGEYDYHGDHMRDVYFATFHANDPFMTVDTDAYASSTGGQGYFTSFCVSPDNRWNPYDSYVTLSSYNASGHDLALGVIPFKVSFWLIFFEVFYLLFVVGEFLRWRHD